jgi:hypothetical protein
MTLTTLPPTHDAKDAWHWLGLAISLSYSLGLNRGPSAPASNLRKKRLEHRIWWTIFVRDRALALGPNGAWVRAVRIRREDCDVQMLGLDDFELGDGALEERDESVDEIRARLNAQACVERARLSWCSSDALVTGLSPAQTHAQTRVYQQHSANAPQHIFIPPHSLTSLSHSQTHPHTATSYSSSSITPLFENPEDASYRLASESSPSLHSDCPTPHEELARVHGEGEVVCGGGNPVMGYGVDGEYDDYLEYLRPSVEDGDGVGMGVGAKMSRVRPRETWAFQLDCENDRVLEV